MKGDARMLLSATHEGQRARRSLTVFPEMGRTSSTIVGSLTVWGPRPSTAPRVSRFGTVHNVGIGSDASLAFWHLWLVKVATVWHIRRACHFEKQISSI